MVRQLIMAAVLAVSGLTPAAAQEREWSLASAGEDVFLVFGVPDTPDIGVSFWCKAGSKDISLFTAAPQAGPHKSKLTLSVTVNDHSYDLAAKTGGEASGTSVEAPLKPQAEILAALAEADHFKVTVGKHVSTFPLTNADFKGLQDMCAKPAVEPAE